MQELWEALEECVPSPLPDGVQLRKIPPKSQEDIVGSEYLIILSAFADMLQYAACTARPESHLSLWMQSTSPTRFHVGIANTGNTEAAGTPEESMRLDLLARAKSRRELAIPYAAQEAFLDFGASLRVRTYEDWGYTVYIMLPKCHGRVSLGLQPRMLRHRHDAMRRGYAWN